jgi:uncharacterized membrane protein YsdA (DUF1294 family)
MRTALAVSGSFVIVLAVLVFARILPEVILPGYLILSVISFGAYALDKWAAQRGASRTPELTLHLLAVAGGWPGALLAQQALHHKTIKQPFRRLFWVSVGINCALLAAFLFRNGSIVGQH